MFKAFQVAVMCLVVLATLDVIRPWLDLLHAHTLSPLEPSVSPFWIVGLVGLCALQIALLWRSRIALEWWELILIESVLCMAFAICRHQVVGDFLTSCFDGGCTTTHNAIIHGASLGGFAAIGAALGILWSLASRSSRETASSQ
jgi:hypothetical protein